MNTCLNLTSASLYKAWGDKRGLFLAALDRCIPLRTEAIAAGLASANSGREKIQAQLTHYACLSCEAAGRTGCLVVETAVGLSLADEEIASVIAAQLLILQQGICVVGKTGSDTTHMLGMVGELMEMLE